MVIIWVLVLLLIIVLIYSASVKKNIETGGGLTSEGMTAAGLTNYIKLYDRYPDNSVNDYSKIEPAYENSIPGHIKFALRGDVKGIDVNLPIGEESYIEIWNVRAGQTLASTASDFYENTIYTTPSYLRGVSPNLTLIARVRAGERYLSSDLPVIHKVLIVGRL